MVASPSSGPSGVIRNSWIKSADRNVNENWRLGTVLGMDVCLANSTATGAPFRRSAPPRVLLHCKQAMGAGDRAQNGPGVEWNQRTYVDHLAINAERGKLLGSF